MLTLDKFWEDDDLAVNSEAGRRGIAFASLKRLKFEPKKRVITRDPFSLKPQTDVTFDVECYWNYFLVGFKHLPTQQYFYMEKDETRELDTDALRRALFHFRLIGFNSKGYDIPMIEAACRGSTCEELKELTNAIIKEGERKSNPNAPYNHVDIIQVAPLRNSLKGYTANLHAERIQELPIDENSILSDEDKRVILDYNFNDLDNTELLFEDPKYGLRPHVDLRERLGKEIEEDIRSKSDAQVAEAFINARVAKLTGYRPRVPELPEGTKFHYKAPAWVSYMTPDFQRALDILQTSEFVLDASGAPIMPREVAKLRLKLGVCEYKLGMGGVHSSEKTIAYRADNDHYLIDTDVASYYPWIMILNGLYPPHIGPIFLDIFRDDLVLRRLALKKLKDKLEAGLKIAINGTFGKQGNKYSTIFTPSGVIQTTVTGQLGLLMPIEWAELAGFQVVSANTDGFVTVVPKRRYDEFQRIIKQWEKLTGFETEETAYHSLFSRDVNNYIAVKLEEERGNDGKVLVNQFGRPIWSDRIAGTKTKGTYSERGSAQNSVLSKNPNTLICSDAVQAFLSKGTPIEDTITMCRDIRRFVVVRNVKGGAHKDGYYLGRVVRWYYAHGMRGEINYVTTGNKVPDSDGAKPYMELGALPNDIDLDYYIRKAYGMLRDIGYFGGTTRQKTLF